MPRWTAFAITLVFAGALVSAAPANADEVENFYRGRTVEMLVGSASGGGNDLWARIIARHIGRYIPGEPAIVVKNVTGAGGLTLANFLANQAPRDGSVFGTFQRGNPFAPLFEGANVQFDPLAFNYIGSPSLDSHMCAVRQDRQINTAKDLLTRDVVMGASGAGDEPHLWPLILKNMFGAKVKIIVGYKGTADILLAAERGEVDGFCFGTETVRRTQAYADGKLKIILQMANNPDPVLGNIPLVTDFIKDETDRAVIDLIFARIDMGRPFVTPPGVPAARVEALRKAFMETMNDPAFKADVEKATLQIRPSNGKTLEALVRKTYAAPKPIIERAVKLLAGQ